MTQAPPHNAQVDAGNKFSSGVNTSGGLERYMVVDQ